jgi:cell division transport system permease protein
MKNPLADTHVSFLPRDGAASGILPWVIAVMVFLSGLALVGGLALHRAVGDWSSALARVITVQIAATDPADREFQTTAALDLLNRVPGIATVRRLDQEAIEALLEPWLGAGNISDDLPIPTMIEVTLSGVGSVDVKALHARLAQAAPDARIDDHQQWLGQLYKLARTVQIVAVAIIILVGLTTISIVVFATRAGMAAHRRVIEVVHLVGATDAVIATEFHRTFLRVGLKGSLAGVAGVGLVLAALHLSSLNMADSFLPSLRPTLPEGLALVWLPLIAATLTMLTARITVLRTLAKMV